MHVLTVGYGRPEDPTAFDNYYRDTHVPLADKIPGVRSFTYRKCASLDGSEPPYYMMAELAFDSEQALGEGMSSPEGTAAAGDVPNFATGGATMFVQHD